MKTLEKFEALLESLGGEKRLHYALDSFEAALKEIGNPEKTVKSLIIAGTNGKGSTTLFISNALRRAGHKVATYLSPHLQSPVERFLLNLEPMGVEALLALAEEHLPLAQKHSLSYFEFLTLLYFVAAERWQADFSVLEVGLGGRLDATNVTDAIASVVTNISFDHQALLGNTLEAILNEKLGILRPESLLFTGVTQPALLEQIEKRCMELDAVYYYSKELRIEQGVVGWKGQSATINGYPITLTNPSPGTLKNAALAFLLMRITFPKIPVEILQRAFAEVQTPGRMEIVQENPRVILSGDHNEAGLDVLAATLKELKPSRLLTICGFSPDKPYIQMYKSLKNISDEILLTQVTRLSEQTTSEYKALGPFEPNPCNAVETLLAKAQTGDTVLVTGSLYLVGEVRKMWTQDLHFTS